MEGGRAAAALLVLAACLAFSAAAPVNEQTGLDLYDGGANKDGCYYNFQHYGEGDRIMTNEPCLNCTCHNRMLMCYLRVCPFTKPIGQDCTIEKRGDQCCPVITCPDVHVDLLTSTSTTSPAEYGSSDIGHLEKYGCSIGGKFYSEGSKVPPTPNKPCELCYCIRNMTACVMQECTLHVDGCTPVYHKDVCCPVRYSCDHLEDEILMLDDMTTTVRPTPGFLLTTTVPPSVTQDCVHEDGIFADGALIKTEKACEHCYCMKGDIVCVVQECGTPMENEGKNCTSLAPREGQCCPDTYICENDVIEDTTSDELLTTFLPTYQTPEPFEGSGEEEPSVTTQLPEEKVEGSGIEAVGNEDAAGDQSGDTILEVTNDNKPQEMATPSVKESEITTPAVPIHITEHEYEGTSKESVVSVEYTLATEKSVEKSPKETSEKSIEPIHEEQSTPTALDITERIPEEAEPSLQEIPSTERSKEDSTIIPFLETTMASDDKLVTTETSPIIEHETSEPEKEITTEHIATTEKAVRHETSDQGQEQSTEQLHTPGSEKPEEQSTEKMEVHTTQIIEEQSSEKLHETSTEELYEHSTEKLKEQTTEQPDYQSTDKFDEQSTNKLDENATENPKEQYTDKLDEQHSTTASPELLLPESQQTTSLPVEEEPLATLGDNSDNEKYVTTPALHGEDVSSATETPTSGGSSESTPAESTEVPDLTTIISLREELEMVQNEEIPENQRTTEIPKEASSETTSRVISEDIITTISPIHDIPETTQENVPSNSEEPTTDKENGIDKMKSEEPLLSSTIPSGYPEISAESTSPKSTDATEVLESQPEDKLATNKPEETSTKESMPTLIEESPTAQQPEASTESSFEEQPSTSNAQTTPDYDETKETTKSSLLDEKSPTVPGEIEPESESPITAIEADSTKHELYENMTEPTVLTETSVSPDTSAYDKEGVSSATSEPVKEIEVDMSTQTPEDNLSASVVTHTEDTLSVTDAKVTEISDQTTLSIQEEIATTTEKLELSSKPELTEVEPEVVSQTERIQSTTLAADVIMTTSVPDLSENEIHEEEPNVILPHIPGEGDCLVDGITYTNDSLIPNSNKCQTSCRCVSSIVKCEPVQCSPPPENMINCQPMYDAKESCCPTYVCDHSKETVAPESHNQMLDTTSEQPSIDKKEDTTTPKGITDTSTIPSCSSEDCQTKEEVIVPVQVPELCSSEGCVPLPGQSSVPNRASDEVIPGEVDEKQVPLCTSGDCGKQEQPIIPVAIETTEECTHDSCTSTKKDSDEVSHSTPSEPATDVQTPTCSEEGCDIPKSTTPEEPSRKECKNGECESETPKPLDVPCTGDECEVPIVVQSSDEDCKDEKCEKPGTIIPESQEKVTMPQQPSSEACTSGECEQSVSNIPDIQGTVAPCEADQCDVVKTGVPVQPSKDCIGEECKIPVSETPQIQETIVPCAGDQCEVPKIDVPVQLGEDCIGEECKLPVSKTTDIPETVIPCEGDQCDVTKIEVPVQANEDCSGEECKVPVSEATEIPETVVPCQGDQCDVPKIEVPVQPSDYCNGEECKKPVSETPVVQETVVPCEGDQCDVPKIEVLVQPSEDCSGEKCKIPVSETPEIQKTVVPCEGDQCDVPKIEVLVQPGEDCSGEECKIPVSEIPGVQETVVPCEGDQCDVPKIEVLVQPGEDCSGDECKLSVSEITEIPETVIPCEGDQCDVPKIEVLVQPSEDCSGEECKLPVSEATEIPETVIPCEGDQCDVPKIEGPVKPSEDCSGEECKIPVSETPGVQETVVPCEGDQCDVPKIEVPVQPSEDCSDEKCKIPVYETPGVQETVVPCEGDQCDVPKIEVPVRPSEDCSGEECIIHVSETPGVQETVIPCEGDQCDVPKIEGPVKPSEDCSGEECKIPVSETPGVQETVVPCEGDQCDITKIEVPVQPSEDCSGEECKIPVPETPGVQETVVPCEGDHCDVPKIEVPVRPSEACSGEECKIPVSETPGVQQTVVPCEGDQCELPKIDVPIQPSEDCSGEECKLPVSETTEIPGAVVPCEGDQCDVPKIEVPIQPSEDCSGEECKIPVSETPGVQETVAPCEGDQCDVPKIEVPVQSSEECKDGTCEKPISKIPEFAGPAVGQCVGDQCNIPKVVEPEQTKSEDCMGGECKKQDSNIPEIQGSVDIPCDGDQCNVTAISQSTETVSVSESIPTVIYEVTENQFISTVTEKEASEPSISDIDQPTSISDNVIQTTQQIYNATTAIYNTEVSDESQNEIDDSSQPKQTTELVQDVRKESSTPSIMESESEIKYTAPTTLESIVTENPFKEIHTEFNEIPTESSEYSSPTDLPASLPSDKATTQRLGDETEDFAVTLPPISIEQSTDIESIESSTAVPSESEDHATEFNVGLAATEEPIEKEQEAPVTSDVSSDEQFNEVQESEKTTKVDSEPAATESYTNTGIITLDYTQQQTELPISTNPPIEVKTTISEDVKAQTMDSSTSSDVKLDEPTAEEITKPSLETTTAYSVELEQHTHVPQDAEKPIEGELESLSTPELFVTENEPELTTVSVLHDRFPPAIESHTVETEAPKGDVESTTTSKITEEPKDKEEPSKETIVGIQEGTTEEPTEESDINTDFTIKPSQETILPENQIGLTGDQITSEITTAASIAPELIEAITEKQNDVTEINTPRSELDSDHVINSEKTTDATEPSNNEIESGTTVKTDYEFTTEILPESGHLSTILPVKEEYSTIMEEFEPSSPRTTPVDQVTEGEQKIYTNAPAVQETTPATSFSESSSVTMEDIEQYVTEDASISEQPQESNHEITEPTLVTLEPTTQAPIHILDETTVVIHEDYSKSTEEPDEGPSEGEIPSKQTTILPMQQSEEGSGGSVDDVTVVPEATETPAITEEELASTKATSLEEKDSSITESSSMEPPSIDDSGRRTDMPNAPADTSTEGYVTASIDITQSPYTNAPEDQSIEPETTSPRIDIEQETTILEEKITTSTPSSVFVSEEILSHTEPTLSDQEPLAESTPASSSIETTARTETEYSPEVSTIVTEKEAPQIVVTQKTHEDGSKPSEEQATTSILTATEESTTTETNVSQGSSSVNTQAESEILTTARPSGASITQSLPEEETEITHEQSSTMKAEESPKTTSADQFTNAYELSSSVSPIEEKPLTEETATAHTEAIDQETTQAVPISTLSGITDNRVSSLETTSVRTTKEPIREYEDNSTLEDVKTTAHPAVTDLNVTDKPDHPSDEKTHPATTTATSVEEEQKPMVSDELPGSTGLSELPSPGEDLDHQSPEQFPSPGYGGEQDYEEEDQPFGPGTCRYGGKVYVSAQQIPRDDPCDFCFCFRSDIICLQQSCPPPIHGCHEEPINGFCCPRYECPVSMATTLNVTTTTTTTTTTLPPHFLPHAYKGAAQRRGCQIKGHSYQVGEVVRASSGPCLHCTCGGDGQMKCDPKVCTPEPMLRQMIAAAVSTKRRR